MSRAFSHSLRYGVVLGWALLAGGCGEDETLPLYRVAAEALGHEAHQGREMVVNPFFFSPGNPRIPPGALSRLQAAGFSVMGAEGQEDPGKATLYFTPAEETGEDAYRVRVFVSLGGRVGSRNREASWWLVRIRCGEGCVASEVARDGPFQGGVR